MTHPKFAVWTAFALGLTLAGCSDSGSDTSVRIESVVQDLGLDPDGETTVVTMRSAVSGLTHANLQCDGGQSPLSVVTVGDEVTVTWDARVTPSHRVRIVNASEVSSAYVDVETSDASAPTFVISGAQQVVGLGGDIITVQFSGPRVIEAEAEDLSNWRLTVDSQVLSLAGSSFDLDPLTGELTIVTGDAANLHANFTLAALDLHSVADVALAATAVVGAAAGDAVAPTLLSVEQNLAEDEFGRVVDFTFDEAMDPLFAASTARFQATSPDLALQVSQPTPEVLRVRFNNPMVPGVDSVTVTGVVDAHGNAMANQLTPIAAGSTVANGFTSPPELVTVANAGSDYLLVTFDQAIDPDDASDDAHWELTYDDGGGAALVDLSSATLDYDLLNKTLTIQLADDYRNGDVFTFEGAVGNLPLDVDGQAFAESWTGAVAGETVSPTLLTAVQRRNLDTLGRTVDVSFSEDLDETSAEELLNWSATGLTVQNATLVSSRVVRVEFDAAAVPGDATLDVAGVEDLAGNAIVAVVGQALTSTDLRRPEGLTSLARAIEGLDNDTLAVSFSDRLIEAEVEDPANWSFESPVGTPIDLTNAVIAYDDDARSATLTFVVATGVDLQTDDDYVVGWSNLRDLGGNVVTTKTLTGEIDAEIVLPTVVSTWVETATPNVVHVRFSEPCQKLDDLAGLTLYQVYDAGALLKGPATAVNVDVDRMGVELTFAFAAVAGSDTLAMRGVLDAAGNPLFAQNGLTIEVEEGQAPALDVGLSTLTSFTGERNDVVEVVFDRALQPWGLLDAGNFDLELLGADVDLTTASFSFDGDRTVTIVLDGPDADSLVTGAAYDLTVQGVQSAQGVAMVGTSSDTIVVGGDAGAPALPAGWARIDASSSVDTLLLTFDEALETASAENVANYLLNGATAPDSAELLGLRTVRVMFSGGVIVGDTIDFTNLSDLAGNLGFGTRAVSAADVSGPVVVAAAAYSVAGEGQDYFTVEFNRPVELTSALSTQNYTLSVGGSSIDLTDAQPWWSSSSLRVTIVLPQGVDLPYGATVSIGAVNLVDYAGLAMNPAAQLNVAVQGDSTAPDFADAFVNWRESASGTVVDVLFTEAVDSSFALNVLSWSVDGAPHVVAVERRAPDCYRLELSGALTAGDGLELVSLPDLAGNVSGAITIVPVH